MVLSCREDDQSISTTIIIEKVTENNFSFIERKMVVVKIMVCRYFSHQKYRELHQNIFKEVVNIIGHIEFLSHIISKVRV